MNDRVYRYHVPFVLDNWERETVRSSVKKGCRHKTGRSDGRSQKILGLATQMQFVLNRTERRMIFNDFTADRSKGNNCYALTSTRYRVIRCLFFFDERNENPKRSRNYGLPRTGEGARSKKCHPDCKTRSARAVIGVENCVHVMADSVTVYREQSVSKERTRREQGWRMKKKQSQGVEL